MRNNHHRSDGTGRRREWTTLPPNCTIPVPDWPSYFEPPTEAENEMWQRLWRMPQANIWHRDHCGDLVSLYVRQFIEAAQPGAQAATRTAARHTAATLALTAPGLRSARLRIPEEDDEGAFDFAGPIDGNPLPNRSSVRARMKVIRPEAAQGGDA